MFLIKLLDFLDFDTISHHIINKYYKLCSNKIVYTKHLYFWGSPYGWPGIVVRELGRIISMYVSHKKLDKIKHLNKF